MLDSIRQLTLDLAEEAYMYEKTSNREGDSIDGDICYGKSRALFFAANSLLEIVNHNEGMKVTISSITVNAVHDTGSELNYGVGIISRAVVRYTNPYGVMRLEILTSGGIFDVNGYDTAGVEICKMEELAALKTHLSAFGIDLSNFDELAAKANVIYHDA